MKTKKLNKEELARVEAFSAEHNVSMAFVLPHIKIYMSTGSSLDEALTLTAKLLSDTRATAKYPNVELAQINPDAYLKTLHTLSEKLEETAYVEKTEKSDFIDPIIYINEEYPIDDEEDSNEQNHDVRKAWFNGQQLIRSKKLITSSRDTRDAAYPLEIFSKMEKAASKPTLPIHDSTIDERLVALKETHPLFSHVIEFYRAQLRLSLLRGAVRFAPVLLVGSAGIGKTKFALDVAHAIGTDLTISDMSGVSEAWVLTGLRSSWGQARAGLIAEALINSTTLSPIVFMDEIDKPSEHGRDPRRSLYQILEQTTASRFVDEFLEVEMDTSQIIYLAAANDINGIPKPLLSRFKVFEIANPTIEQQHAVLQHIYTAETQGLDVFSPTLSLEVLNELSNISLREAKLKIQEIIGKILLSYSLAEFDKLKGSHKLTIETHHFEKKVIEPEPLRKMGF
ncbi:AAA family ATPase [Burkholderia cepacia]|nr:AAA family ATPase [Burkholderia cepacia]MDO5943327.1 AAA family ATPase [Burkholderia cepacia]